MTPMSRPNRHPSPSDPPLRLADIREALSSTLLADASLLTAVANPNGSGRVAAVAAVLREPPSGVEVLFIRRATHHGDPWSGHMAWPGGKREPGDEDLLACAVRETREEIGLDLAACAEPIGTLRAWRHEGRAAGRLRGVFPFVFALQQAVDLTPGDEVQEAVWIPLSYFTNWSRRAPWSWAARWLPRVPPAYRYQGRLIWGLTQWMLADLLQRLDGLLDPTPVPPAGRAR